MENSIAEKDLGRKMARASLLGRHSHSTAIGVEVHIWRRGETFLARGRIHGKAFGPTLGKDVKTAETKLCRMLTEINDGRFERPSTICKRSIKRVAPERLTFLDLCDRYLTDTRKRNGEKTWKDYRNRLMHVIRFSENPENRRRWPYARDIDRDFALALKEYLHGVVTTRNGKPGGTPIPLSARHIFNVMERVQSVVHWALRPEIRLLPFDFLNPFTNDIVGNRTMKDPLREHVLPLESRIALVRHLDRWQLFTIGLLTLFPFRPAELQGILISDIDFTERTIRVGTRFQGCDYTKEKISVCMPFPEELSPVLKACAGVRSEGPLFLRRSIWNRSRTPKIEACNRGEIQSHIQKRLMESSKRVSSDNDRKEIARSVLRDLGSVDTKQLAVEFKKTILATGKETFLYQLRSAVSTDMARAGIRHLELRYLTGHSIKDIMNDYVTLDTIGEMKKYFDFAKPLLEAIRHRGEELGCIAM